MINDFAAEKRALTVDFLERFAVGLVRVAVLDGDAGFETADAVVEAHLVRGPDRVVLQRVVDRGRC